MWWTDGSADFNRRLARNTPYREWFEQAERWEEAILSMLEGRNPSSTICPSDVARHEKPRGWRKHMDEVRDAARRLARRDAVIIMQRGRVLDPDSEFHGPVRIARPR
ncbi:MAG TPA: DUF3253 domain-containing protein [Thermoanaerobaculia bacterium]|nr:DUF3253 domain-containing protein [Thermoanaerobaculia bacterium]